MVTVNAVEMAAATGAGALVAVAAVMAAVAVTAAAVIVVEMEEREEPRTIPQAPSHCATDIFRPRGTLRTNSKCPNLHTFC